MLFDLEKDPEQMHPIQNKAVEAEMIRNMVRLMRQNEAPEEQYLRLGLAEEDIP